MNSSNPSTGGGSRASRSMISNPRAMKTIQTLSRIITILFLIALAWAVYQAVVNGNPLPIWAWIGLLVLFAVAVGLIVMAVVYRGVSREVGPFDFRNSAHVSGELQTEARRVETGQASSLRARFEMLQGILQLSGGAEEGVEIDFTFDDADWEKPVVDYSVDGASQANLAVEQKATGRPAMRQGRCEWVVRLDPDLPTELAIRFGAGKAGLKLGGLDLTSVRVESGVGELDMDLRGEWKRSLEIYLKAGIGDTRLRLPSDVGLRVSSTVGFGSIHARGLTKGENGFTNDLYGQGRVNLDITVEGGMGKVTIE